MESGRGKITINIEDVRNKLKAFLKAIEAEYEIKSTDDAISLAFKFYDTPQLLEPYENLKKSVLLKPEYEGEKAKNTYQLEQIIVETNRLVDNAIAITPKNIQEIIKKHLTPSISEITAAPQYQVPQGLNAGQNATGITGSAATQGPLKKVKLAGFTRENMEKRRNNPTPSDSNVKNTNVIIDPDYSDPVALPLNSDVVDDPFSHIVIPPPNPTTKELHNMLDVNNALLNAFNKIRQNDWESARKILAKHLEEKGEHPKITALRDAIYNYQADLKNTNIPKHIQLLEIIKREIESIKDDNQIKSKEVKASATTAIQFLSTNIKTLSDSAQSGYLKAMKNAKIPANTEQEQNLQLSALQNEFINLYLSADDKDSCHGTIDGHTNNLSILQNLWKTKNIANNKLNSLVSTDIPLMDFENQTRQSINFFQLALQYSLTGTTDDFLKLAFAYRQCYFNQTNINITANKVPDNIKNEVNKFLNNVHFSFDNVAEKNLDTLLTEIHNSTYTAIAVINLVTAIQKLDSKACEEAFKYVPEGIQKNSKKLLAALKNFESNKSQDNTTKLTNEIRKFINVLTYNPNLTQLIPQEFIMFTDSIEPTSIVNLKPTINPDAEKALTDTTSAINAAKNAYQTAKNQYDNETRPEKSKKMKEVLDAAYKKISNAEKMRTKLHNAADSNNTTSIQTLTSQIQNLINECHAELNKITDIQSNIIKDPKKLKEFNSNIDVIIKYYEAEIENLNDKIDLLSLDETQTSQTIKLTEAIIKTSKRIETATMLKDNSKNGIEQNTYDKIFALKNALEKNATANRNNNPLVAAYKTLGEITGADNHKDKFAIAHEHFINAGITTLSGKDLEKMSDEEKSAYETAIFLNPVANKIDPKLLGKAKEGFALSLSLSSIEHFSKATIENLKLDHDNKEACNQSIKFLDNKIAELKAKPKKFNASPAIDNLETLKKTLQERADTLRPEAKDLNGVLENLKNDVAFLLRRTLSDTDFVIEATERFEALAKQHLNLTDSDNEFTVNLDEISGKIKQHNDISDNIEKLIGKLNDQSSASINTPNLQKSLTALSEKVKSIQLRKDKPEMGQKNAARLEKSVLQANRLPLSLDLDRFDKLALHVDALRKKIRYTTDENTAKIEINELLKICINRRDQLDTYFESTKNHIAYKGDAIKAKGIADKFQAVIDKIENKPTLTCEDKRLFFGDVHTNNTEEIKAFISDNAKLPTSSKPTPTTGLSTEKPKVPLTVSDKTERLIKITVDNTDTAIHQHNDSGVFKTDCYLQDNIGNHEPIKGGFLNRTSIPSKAILNWAAHVVENHLVATHDKNKPVNINGAFKEDQAKAIALYCAANKIDYRNNTSHQLEVKSGEIELVTKHIKNGDIKLKHDLFVKSKDVPSKNPRIVEKEIKELEIKTENSHFKRNPT